MTRYAFRRSTRDTAAKVSLCRDDPGRRWVIVLAGGSGTRLASLTASGFGRVVPKQFCSLVGGRSLLGDALARGDELVGREHVVTVVARQHQLFWQGELRDRAPENVVVQPRNRGTAAGVLLPLLSILARDPQADVTVLPSDHFVADEVVLAETLRETQVAAGRDTDRVILVGIEPDGPEVDYGWIVPRPNGQALPGVRRFVEKPDRRGAMKLMRIGGVWNSFMLAGSGQTVLRLYAERAPDLLAAFSQGLVDGQSPAATDRLYGSLPEVDFCRRLLTGSEARLGISVAPPCGWTDLGTPSRVARCAELMDRGTLANDSLAAVALRAESNPYSNNGV